jgi:flagellar hook-associated protein 1 FlgK
MSSGLLSIGLSGLNAAQAGMTTTSENIANVNTTGYSEESVVQSEASPVFSGGGYLGTGVDVDTVTRAYSAYQQQQVVQATASSGELSTQYSQMSQIDNLLGDPTTGISAAVDSFFTSAQTLADSPSDSSARTAFLSQAQTMSDTFNSVAGQLSALSQSTNQSISENVASVNTEASEIATLNQQIISAKGSSQSPNTLLDQRDALVTQVNQQIGATSITQSDGSVDLYVGNGQPLVTGITANKLSAVQSSSDPGQLQLAVTIGKSSVTLGSAQLSGGSLTGLLSFNNGALQNAINTVGQIADGVAAAVNSQNQLGQDANGNLGKAIFAIPSPVVTAAATNSASGAISTSISNAAALTGSNYQLKFDGTNYTLTRLSDGTTTSYSSLPQSVDGVTIALGSPLSAGDSFTIAPTAAGASQMTAIVSDPNLVAAASPVRASLADSNSGDLTTSNLAVSASAPLSSAIQDNVKLTFTVSGSTSTYSAVDTTTGTTLASNAAYTAGSAINLNGWSLTLNGTPGNGDTVFVGANSGGTSDNSNALLLAGLATQNVTSLGSASSAYQDMVANIGTQTASLKSTSTAQANILTDASATQAATSGVNLDDEAANLLKYQQAYQASSQAIATANNMFTAILQLFA